MAVCSGCGLLSSDTVQMYTDISEEHDASIFRVKHPPQTHWYPPATLHSATTLTATTSMFQTTK